MKVGDLVTLSEYGTNLEALWWVTTPARSGKLVGMVVEVLKNDNRWDMNVWYQVQNRFLYYSNETQQIKQSHRRLGSTCNEECL